MARMKAMNRVRITRSNLSEEKKVQKKRKMKALILRTMRMSELMHNIDKL